MDSPAVSTSRCAHCQLPAKQICAGCKDTPAYESPTPNTYYCSPKCQKDGWPNHKSTCKRLKTRKMLFRAGSLLQDIFYVYREQMFDKNIVKIEEKDGKLHLHEGIHAPLPQILTPNDLLATPLDVLYTFPSSLISDPRDKKSILTYSSAEEGIAWMQDLTNYVLKGICSDFQELYVGIRDRQRHLVMASHFSSTRDTMDDPHIILKLKLRDTNEWYILDLGGAQYGLFDAITPAARYGSADVRDTINTIGGDGFGETKKRLIWLSNRRDPVGYVTNLNFRVIGSLMKGVEAWEKEHSSTISALLRLKNAEFERGREVLLAKIGICVNESVEVLKQEALEFRARAAAGTLLPDDIGLSH